MLLRFKWFAICTVIAVLWWSVGGAIAVEDDGTETLLVIEPTARQTRNSEGDFIQLADGRLGLIYTRFTGGGDDHSAADLAMCTSADGGRTWSDDKIVVPNEGGQNVMSVSLLRLAKDKIALFYLRKNSATDCRPQLRISTDEAKTWSEPTACIPDEHIGYYVLNNDRVVQLSSGRLVVPVAKHHQPGQDQADWNGTIMCYLSDDNGKSWRRSADTRQGFSPSGKRITVQEPGVVELAGGRLMIFCRASGGSQYVGFSEDGGDTWSQLQPSNLASPVSPAAIERIPWNDELLCVWNDHSGLHPHKPGRRTPLCVATSADDGRTWSRSRAIESDPDGWYCYTAVHFEDDRVLLAYCAGDKQVGTLNRLKVRALSKNWLTADSAGAKDKRKTVFPVQPCLNYGRSFINTKAAWNSPRFWVESRLILTDTKAGKTTQFYQCGSCKSEDTFADRDLFFEKNYDFLPAFSDRQCLIFRRRLNDPLHYRSVVPIDEAWGGITPKLCAVRGRLLTQADEIFAALDGGTPIVGQTELYNPATGRSAVIEYPVKTINWHRERKVWQVDTGPLLLPDLSVPLDKAADHIQLAFIAFNQPGWADFVVEQQTPLGKAEGDASVFHYSGLVHKRCRNVLIALDNE